MAKNIVVMSDGTGQIGGKGHDTNIYKLFRMLEDRTEQQIVFYDEGLGTDWRKVTGSAFGAGLSKNLLQCYEFIFENYNAGDRIYLFGFSRGAATVRSLASFIHYFGILPRSRPELIKEAFKIYRSGQEKPGTALAEDLTQFSRERTDRLREQARKILRQDDTAGSELEDIIEDEEEDLDNREEKLNKRAAEFIHEHPNQWAKIEFLGVWDTVPAIGVVALAGLNSILGKILKYNFHNFKLHPSIKNAYHALAIDDDRAWFHPSLWTEKTRDDQIVEQVWFSGAHTDIGGGFVEAGLSDITLEWMASKAVSHGLRLYLGSRKYWNFVIAPDATDLDHDPRAGFGKIFKKEVRDQVWFKLGADETVDPTFGITEKYYKNSAASTFGPPIIHAGVVKRLEGKKLERVPWYLEHNPSRVAEFESFLRIKFIEYLYFEWRKFTTWEDPSIEFKGWLRKKSSDYFDDQTLKEGKADTKPNTRAWLEKEFNDWRQKHIIKIRKNEWEKHQIKIQKTDDPPETEYTEFFIEPVQKLEDVSGPEALKKEINRITYNKDEPLRDYDQESISGDPVRNMIETIKFKGKTFLGKVWEVVKIKKDGKILEEINSERMNLVLRGKNERQDRHDRLGYDLERWKNSENKVK